MMTPEIVERQRIEFGVAVQTVRESIAKLSVDEVAARAGSGPDVVKSLEAGNPTCDYEEIARICRVLEIPVPIIYLPDIIF